MKWWSFYNAEHHQNQDDFLSCLLAISEQAGIHQKKFPLYLLYIIKKFIIAYSDLMAHLKLDLLLTETGYTSKHDERFWVYLTNALEEHHPDTGTLFASWLSQEANEANFVKRDTPVMIVSGNPPYSVCSSNEDEWIQKIREYCK